LTTQYHSEFTLVKRVARSWLNLPLGVKISSLFVVPFYGLMGLLELIAVILLSPFFRLRIGRISSDRIGHFILEYDWYFSFLKTQMEEKQRRSLDVFFYSGGICNSYLDKLWKRNALIVPRALIYPLYAFLRIIPGLSNFLVTLPSRPTDFSVLDGLPSSIRITVAEVELGTVLLQSVGIQRDSKLVCLYVRDSAYVESLGLESGHTSYRDSAIENYLPLIENLISRGYFVVRMGTVARGRVDLDSPKYFDYVNSAIRSDFLDFFISSRCNFAISTDSGMMQFPIAFRKPLGLVNVPAYHGLIKGQCLTLFQFKTFLDSSSQTELNLNELKARGFENVDNLEGFRAIGISHLENSASELANFGNELVDFLDDPLKKEVKYLEIKDSFNRIAGLDFSTTQIARLSLSWCKNHPKFLLDS
jgi:putative glycosyltransferase (TIGR04372 family)